MVQGWLQLEDTSDSNDEANHEQVRQPLPNKDNTSAVLPQEETNASGGRRPNVVLILLESMRADLMPFDTAAHWLDSGTTNLVRPLKETITPFYTHWTSSPETVFFPQVQSVSGVTHKSLLSILCSQHGLPTDVTVEHKKQFLHDCLPTILTQYGYQTQLFKSMTRNFDNQLGLARKIGYPKMFGMEDYQSKYNLHSNADLQKVKSHFMGLQDFFLIEPILEWVDHQQNTTDPFFLTYMTGVTHHPYTIPSYNYSPKHFSGNTDINNLFNCISYTDQFLQKLYKEFEQRNLTENTYLLSWAITGWMLVTTPNLQLLE